MNVNATGQLNITLDWGDPGSPEIKFSVMYEDGTGIPEFIKFMTSMITPNAVALIPIWETRAKSLGYTTEVSVTGHWWSLNYWLTKLVIPVCRYAYENSSFQTYLESNKITYE